jgi:hypothetical protein
MDALMIVNDAAKLARIQDWSDWLLAARAGERYNNH